MTWLEIGINSCISIFSLQCKCIFYIKALFHMKWCFASKIGSLPLFCLLTSKLCDTNQLLHSKNGGRGIFPMNASSLFMVFVSSMLFPDSGGGLDAPKPSSMLFLNSGFEIAKEPLGRNHIGTVRTSHINWLSWIKIPIKVMLLTTNISIWAKILWNHFGTTRTTCFFQHHFCLKWFHMEPSGNPEKRPF